MKIEDRGFSPVRKKNNKKSERPEPSRPREDFKAHLSKIEQKEIKDRLDRLLEIVDVQGEKLKKSLDKEDLFEYKRRVQDFLRLIQKEFVKAKQSFSWDGAGNLKTYTIVEKVNKNLDTLHDLFLKDQADVLQVVKKIDEIRGLLIDLYI
ncbi:MAG: YaaR family protein [Halanaerobiales bacterium]